MMKERRFVLGTLALTLAALGVCAALVWYADPCFYFRFPGKIEPVFFSERYQNAGMAKHAAADTVVMGTSMTANYRVSEVEAAFGGTAVKLTFPDGYLSEFDQAMDTVFRHHTPERVLFGLDINVLTRDESKKTDALPAYLYNKNPLDDVNYILNKDTLYYSLYRIKCNQWGTTGDVDQAFTWDGDVWWSKATALAGYQRPEVSGESVADTAYHQNAVDNVKVILSWANRHPETEFDVFFPPYSMLYWDKMQRTGATDAVFSALEMGMRYLTENQRQENIRVFFFPAQEDIVTDLDNYGDYIHHSGAVCSRLIGELAAGEYEIDPAETADVLSDWKEFVVHYDYDAIWQ
ncbi:hypothetical protein KQI82_02685 [Oscillibacter sp. MSJ-2]|uniref:SGNH/GDSL hydrolase family protein n=1 Tax=Dysosmobacter acutus TaxID=2841504 RepID=A0ABS6F6Q4_9FIRM|nr:hypothetical protein [Dysosmobacter acutus]MBU5625842.1 hypothetical protein [Dysosmobacter acutus]